METTLTLRNRLGFNEVTLWKQFCARRLHLIHTLSLNLRKASEQEEQVRVLAAELCAEYGFGPYAQSDFEKLLIAGIQSVRRNQKRSARHPNGIADAAGGGGRGHDPGNRRGSSDSNQGPNSENPRDAQGMVAVVTPMSVNPRNRDPQYFEPVSPLSENPSSRSNSTNNSNLVHANSHRPDRSITAGPGAAYQNHSLTRGPPGGPLATPMFQSLVVRLEVLRDMIGAGSATWIESSAPTVAHMSAYGVLSTAVAAASVHGKLTQAESNAMRDSILDGPLLESLRLALDPELSRTRLLERIGALAASLVHGPHLLSALQALCVSLAQASHGSENDMRYMLKPLHRGETQTESDTQHRPQQQQHQEQALKPFNTLPHHMNGPPQMMVQPMMQSSQTAPHAMLHHPVVAVQNGSAPHQAVQPGHPMTQTPACAPHTPGVPQYVFQPMPTQLVNTVDGKSAEREGEPPRTGSTQINSGVYSPPQSKSPESSSTHGSVSSTNSLISNASSASSVSSAGIHVGGPDRLVTLQYNDKTLTLTYSPMKATPPTISEIIENGRQSFSIPASTVVRVKDVQRNKIIETNGELIDAFTQEKVKLELLLPPPMLIAMEPKLDFSGGETRFQHLAPIFRTSF